MVKLIVTKAGQGIVRAQGRESLTAVLTGDEGACSVTWAGKDHGQMLNPHKL